LDVRLCGLRGQSARSGDEKNLLHLPTLLQSCIFLKEKERANEGKEGKNEKSIEGNKEKEKEVR
jgi:hypothetical protein